MKSFLFILLALLAAAPSDGIQLADSLFAQRDQSGNLASAVSNLQEFIKQNPANYEALWRLARCRYYLSEQQENKKERMKLLQAGIEAAKSAVALKPERAEGHFWLASNTGESADLGGVFKSLGQIGTIRREFEAALKIDSHYENGASYLALGEMNLRLPGLFGGNEQHGIELLEEGARVAPTNSELKLTLAQTYIKKHRGGEAIKLLQDILQIADPLKTEKEQAETRADAQQLLNQLEKH